MNTRTYVGLDDHARSVKGCAIDRETGEILRRSLAANDAGVAEWVSGLLLRRLQGLADTESAHRRTLEQQLRGAVGKLASGALVLRRRTHASHGAQQLQRKRPRIEPTDAGAFG